MTLKVYKFDILTFLKRGAIRIIGTLGIIYFTAIYYFNNNSNESIIFIIVSLIFLLGIISNLFDAVTFFTISETELTYRKLWSKKIETIELNIISGLIYYNIPTSMSSFLPQLIINIKPNTSKIKSKSIEFCFSENERKMILTFLSKQNIEIINFNTLRPFKETNSN